MLEELGSPKRGQNEEKFPKQMLGIKASRSKVTEKKEMFSYYPEKQNGGTFIDNYVPRFHDALAHSVLSAT